MADQSNEQPAGVPLGAQIMRKIHQGLSSLGAEVTKMAGTLDACEAKDVIGKLAQGIGTTAGEIEKAWSKYYKEHDLAAMDEPAPEMKDEGLRDQKPEDDDELNEALAALDGDDKPKEKADDMGDDEDENMSPEEKAFVLDRIAKLESKARHLERLASVANSK